MTEYHITLSNKDSIEWLHKLITNTLAQPNHQTTINNYEHLVNWDAALNNVDAARPVVEPKPRVGTKRKPKKKVTKEERNNPYGCIEHPTYGGVRRPRTDCPKCWDVFKLLHPQDYALKRREFERIMSKGE